MWRWLRRFFALPAAAADDCDPEVERALVENAKRGAEEDLVVVRHPEAGIRDPDSIFDFSCITDMFDYSHSQIFFDPGRAVSDILGLLQRQICAAAREAYRGYLGRGLDSSLFERALPTLPGLGRIRERGNLLEDERRGQLRPGETGRAPSTDRGVESRPAAVPADTAPAPARRPFGCGSLQGSDWRRRQGAVSMGKSVGAAWVGMGIAVVVLAAPSPAEALFGGTSGRCDRTDNDRAEASRVIRNIAGRLDAMERTIVEALKLQTGQLSGYQAQTGKAIVQALDTKTKLEAQTAREVEESRIVRERRPTRRGCRTATGARGMGAARRAVEEEKRRAAVAGVGRIAADRSVGGGSAADNSERFTFVMERFCSSRRLGEDAKACKGAPEMHAADLNPGNLFDRGTIAPGPERRTAIELSQEPGGAGGERSGSGELGRDQPGAAAGAARAVGRCALGARG